MWALIESNKVIEITDEDPKGRFHPSLMWIECPENVTTGYEYQDGIFTPDTLSEVEIAEEEKQLRIDQANEYMNSKQWPGKAAMGRLKDEEKEQYNAWLDYLDALEAVDTTSAPDIEWPTPPEV
ncbi:tail fiber assembly protein [Enterobacter cancerogenus]|uniref:tail fiber assembly protein n=1 Tax=Enterobacter cancerogenus TaxID=69218 RepID=UPI0012997A8A|nr:tail fiber assembly protein [Enterobacter cancerogenus]MRG31838.1 hypothetical protein [Enterobacter cancerogenus]